jgi:rhodanese-related sulfurtransferase
MCHLGQRSAFVADWMNRQGYDKVYSLAGGIDAWADEVDPSVIVRR